MCLHVLNEAAIQVMQVGDKNRRVGETNMNARSSRSHAIFMIQVECSEIDDDGQPHIRRVTVRWRGA